MQYDRDYFIVVDKDSIDNFGDQLLFRLKRVVYSVAFAPVKTEVAEQVSGFGEAVIIKRSQRLHLLFKLLAFFEIFVFLHPAHIPPKINALDNFIYFLHSLKRRRVLDLVAHSVFNLLLIIRGDLKIRENRDDLAIQFTLLNNTLSTGLVALNVGNAMIVGEVVLSMEVRSHTSVVLVD